MALSLLRRSSLSQGLTGALAAPSGGGAAAPWLPARVGSAPGIPLLLLAVWLSAAALVAPEQPLDQEAICQRHNGAAACRVW